MVQQDMSLFLESPDHREYYNTVTNLAVRQWFHGNYADSDRLQLCPIH